MHMHTCKREIKKVVPVHTTKAYTGKRGTVLLIPDIGIRWRCLVNIVPWPLYPGKEHVYKLNKRLGKPKSWSG
jgi:hypothetical protein